MALAATTIIFGGGTNRPVQASIARAVGVSPSTISRWKENPKLIPLGDLQTLCRIRGLTDEQIVKIIRER